MRVLAAAFLAVSPLPLPGLSFSSQADSSRVEWIKAYFNMPADHSVALPENESNDEADLIGTLETLIDSAAASVDLCIYDLEHASGGRWSGQKSTACAYG